MTKDFEKAVLWKRRAAFLFSRLALSVIRFAHDSSPKGRGGCDQREQTERARVPSFFKKTAPQLLKIWYTGTKQFHRGEENAIQDSGK